MKIFKLTFAIFLFVFAASCAATTDSALEAAQFAMDSCTTANLTACTNAITEADVVLAADSNNAEAALLKSSALATRAGVDILHIISDLAEAETAGNEDRKFRIIHDSLVSSITNLTDLRSAITTLTGITAPTASDVIYKDFFFQLGTLQAMEGFSMPTIESQPTAGAAVTIDATTAIDDTETSNTEDDFVNADDNLRAGGINDSSVTGWDIVAFVRKYYCVLRKQAAVDAVATGFDTAQLRALMRCQLNTNTVIDSLTTNAEFPGTTIANCAAFTYDACEAADDIDTELTSAY